MNPVVHGLVAWILVSLTLKNSRDRRLAVIAGVISDIDGVFILFSMELYRKIRKVGKEQEE